MLRPRIRAIAMTGVLALGLSFLSACGSDEPTDGSQDGGGLDSVSIEGKFGKAPIVKFHGILDPAKGDSEVLIEGDGDTVKDGDTASIHWWAVTGYTRAPRKDGEPDKSKVDDDGGYVVEPGYSTFEAGTPEDVELTKDVIAPLRDAIVGHTVGSRVAVLSSAEDAFGEVGNPQLGVGNKDAVLFVVDVMSTRKTPKPLDGPKGEDRKPAAWAPKLIEKDGAVTGFDFSTGKAPNGGLLATTLIRGDGPVVKEGQTITADYLGQVYKAKAPFDESYSKEPVPFKIGVGAVVKGWDETLVGRNVGSRLILQIPPAKGYGKEGNPSAGIKGTDTLYFVVDILSAS